MTIEILAPTLPDSDLEDLARAVQWLEGQSLAHRLTRALGGGVERWGRRLPSRLRKAAGFAAEGALRVALRAAMRTLAEKAPADAAALRASTRWHRLAAAASGAVGGAFGLPALAIELPVSTTIMLRSIADIARAEGEDLTTPEGMLACLEVFALGSHPPASGELQTQPGEAALESGYFALRAALAQSVGETARFLLRAGAAGETAPVVVRLVSQIAARFGVAVSEKLVVQAAPLLGAAGGAAINAAFASHFQALARGHFIVRRLERKYDPETVKFEYLRLRAREVAAN